MVFKADSAVVQLQRLYGHCPGFFGRGVRLCAGLGRRCRLARHRLRTIEQRQRGCAVLLAQRIDLQAIGAHFVQGDGAGAQVKALHVCAQQLGSQRGVLARGRRQRQVGQACGQRFRAHVEFVRPEFERHLAVGR